MKQRSLSLAIVHLDNLRRNYERILSAINKNTLTIPIIKADAYGHGISKVAEVLSEYESVAYLGVAHTGEGVRLRKREISKDILLLSCIDPLEFEIMYNFNLTPVIHTVELLESMVEFAKRSGKRFKVHLKIDTGMARLGIRVDELEKAVKICKANRQYIEIDGLMSHFSESELDNNWTERQKRLFDESIEAFEANGIYPRLKHIANSTAIFRYPQTHYNCVRPGLSLYGYLSRKELTESIGLKPVLEIRSKLISVHSLKRGEGISYGRTFTASKDMKVGVVAFGYADGLFRCLSNRIDCLIGGKRCKAIGTICMDMFMCDISDISARTMDPVIILGQDGKEKITADELAEKAGTISYEILTNIGKSSRVRRIYRD